MKSMTGFGRGEAFTPDGRILFRTELSSVNRKQFELKTFLPKEMLPAETELRRIISSRISRGSLLLRVEVAFQREGDSAVSINRDLMLSLLKQLQSIAQEAGLQREPQLENLLLVPGILEQKSLDFSGGRTAARSRSTLTGSVDFVSPILPAILVQVIQELGTWIAHKTDRRIGSAAVRNAAAVITQEHLSRGDQISCLCVKETAAPDQLLDRLRFRISEGFQIGQPRKQFRSHQIDPRICTLSRQPHSKQQLPIHIVLQTAQCVRIFLLQPFNDRFQIGHMPVLQFIKIPVYLIIPPYPMVFY